MNYFYPSIGGTQLATYYLAKSLMRIGIETKIVTFNINPAKERLGTGVYSGMLPECEKIDGISVHRFPVVFLGKTRGAHPRFKILFSPAAIRMILRESPDIIHFQGANEILQTFVTSIATSFSRSKKIVTVHGLYAQIESFRKRRFLRYANELLLRLTLWKVDVILALSNHDLELVKYLKLSPSKVRIIPNGIDLARFSNPLDSSKTDQEAGTSHSPFVLCVTRIRESKGIEVLIEASAEVISKRPDVKFILVGNCSNDYALKLSRLLKEFKVEKNFILKGYIPHESDLLVELYHKAAVFVLPSPVESLPLVLLEAMSSGLPIIASKVGGIPDLLTPNEGMLVAPGRVAELSSSILFLLNNEDVRIRLGKNAAKKAERFSWDRIAEKTASVYEQMLGS